MNRLIKSEAHQSLFLATMAFAIAFASWGVIAGIAPLLKQELGLSITQVSIMVAIPVLLAALGRIPLGLLADRFGGRLIFSTLLILGIIPPLALALNHSYLSLLFWGLWLGLAGSSFTVGIAFVSPWFPAQAQGTALGIYGVGNIGQSIALIAGPVLAHRFGIAAPFLFFGLVSLVWGLIFAMFARNAILKREPKPLGANFKSLHRQKLAWVLSLFYALTFGGFVTLSIYLPTLYQETFALNSRMAGGLTGIFVILATFCRPLGGWLSDRIGGKELLIVVFGGIFLTGWILAIPSLPLFNIGVFGSALLLGLGNGGVFKLVPEYFPQQTGTVTGWVGAAGGLGGFFPPIALGIMKDASGSYALGFILLSCFGLLCAGVLSRTLLQIATPIQPRS